MSAETRIPAAPRAAHRPHPSLGRKASKSTRVFRVALIGAGHVGAAYVRQIRGYAGIELAGVASRRAEQAAAFAREHGLKAFGSIDELLADPAIDIVVNLTPHTLHAAITERCLRAGKHVHSEKPLALTHAAARRLASLARRRQLRLSCAPCTFLGEAHQTAWRVLREGRLGTVRVVYAEVNHGRIENYHPAPKPFFEVGPLWDVAVYPLSALTAFFGPVRRVAAHGHLLLPRRTARGGRTFRFSTPDFVVATLQFARGPLVRLTANFCVERDTSKGGGSLEYHGDAGRLFTGDFQLFDAPVEFGAWGRPYAPVPHVRPAFPGVEFGRGVEELAAALREDRPHRCSAEHAAHVVEIVEALVKSAARDGRSLAVGSSFARPAPLPWAEARASGKGERRQRRAI